MKKKVLFIGIGFYDYEQAIISEFNEQGYEVDYFSEVPINTFKYRFFTRFNVVKKVEALRESHCKRISSLCGSDYDIVFVIKCEYLTVKALLDIKFKNPKAKHILYLWDSLHRFPEVREKFEYFDVVYSFDRIDCLNDETLHFNPLFYRKEYAFQGGGNYKEAYDIYHLGWYHSDRLLFMKKLERVLKDKKISYKLILYTGYYNFLIHSILGRELKGNKDFLIFKPLSSKDNFINIQQGKATLDIAHEQQSGLTMRTIELLGAQKKIVTTNKDIVNYDFYNANNIFIIDRENPIIDDSFFETNYEVLPEGILDSYSISKWLQRMIHPNIRPQQ